MLVLFSCLFDQKFTIKSSFYKLLFESQLACALQTFPKFIPIFSLMFSIDILLEQYV